MQEKTPSVNIVIPMAGLGSRFSKVGYTVPKPFIDVLGRPMIQHVIENLQVAGARYILIVRKEHLDNYAHLLRSAMGDVDHEIVPIDFVTEGQACSVLLAHRLINNDTPLLIANSDQIIDIDINDYMNDSKNRGLDGSILTFKDADPKWSFAAIDRDGLVTQTKEKVPISDHATVGIYYFEKGSIFVHSAMDMILSKDRVNGEFYACPVYNYGIAQGHKFGIYEIPQHQMHGTGTPEDLDEYVRIKKRQE
jgi:dTDP-glucose pyrophosphorylase